MTTALLTTLGVIVGYILCLLICKSNRKIIRIRESTIRQLRKDRELYALKLSEAYKKIRKLEERK